MAMTNAAAALGRAFQQDDQRRAADAQERAQKYAALVLRVVDGDLEDVESIDDALAEIGRSREQLADDVRRVEHRRVERDGAARLLEIMAEHRAAEREVFAAERALDEALRAGRARIEQARAAEGVARQARNGPANLADATLRLAPEAWASAFTRAERDLIDVEERLAEAKVLGHDALALERELADATQRAAAAWRAVLAHDPSPGATMRSSRAYEPRPTLVTPVIRA